MAAIKTYLSITYRPQGLGHLRKAEPASLFCSILFAIFILIKDFVLCHRRCHRYGHTGCRTKFLSFISRSIWRWAFQACVNNNHVYYSITCTKATVACDLYCLWLILPVTCVAYIACDLYCLWLILPVTCVACDLCCLWLILPVTYIVCDLYCLWLVLPVTSMFVCLKRSARSEFLRQNFLVAA